MQQLLSLWNALSLRNRVIALLATAAAFAAVLMIARTATTPGMALLYSGLEPASSGEVIAALDQRAVIYEVRGAAIYVDESQRDRLRMALAGEGLPAAGVAGYELLDSLNGFGTTAQMFDAAYWRAIEGELARTILAWPQVRSARVHISKQPTRPFGEKRPPVASVTLRLASGSLDRGRTRALRYLVASAVAGLAPERVSIIDADRGLISQQDGTDSMPAGATDRAAQLKANAERLLSARVGPGNAIVEVWLNQRTDSETIVEKRFDPAGRVAISTETREVSGNSSDSGDAQVTVASNLPEGNGTGAAGKSQSAKSETRERVNYEVSETRREVVRRPGAIERLTVAVLVNGTRGTAADGSATWSPRTDDELASLGELVQSAVGYDESRGDVITIKSLPFQPLPQEGTTAARSFMDRFAGSIFSLLKTALLALATLGIGAFVLRPALRGPAALAALPQPENAGAAQTDDPFGGDFQFAIAGPGDGVAEVEDPVEELRQIISERQDETLEVLRNWIETSESEEAI